MNGYRYWKMTWPEIRQAARENRVAVVPVGTVEDHARHLPVDTDNMIVEEVCHMTGARIPDDMVLLPTVSYGINIHHQDFPGAIDIPANILIEYLVSITKSLARHGFCRIVLINAHGSNKDCVNIAAKRTVWENENVLCVATTPMMMMGSKEINAIRRSEKGGICHAGELETSMYLYKYPEYVKMELAEKEYGLIESEFHGWDRVDSRVVFTDIWSRLSENGCVGDPTVATRENGQAFFESAVNNFAAFIREYRNWPIKKRVDKH